jgi:predicted site-specific integrase-resolvase
MPVTLNGCKYYRTAEVCRRCGISRTTLFRWLAEGIFKEPEIRDRRGWRLFTEEEVDMMESEANRISHSGRSARV